MTNFKKVTICPLLGVILVACMSVCVLASCASNNGEIKTNTCTPSINWSKDTVAKYRDNDNVGSLICVQADEGTNAKVIMYKKDKVGAVTTWTNILECSAFIGKDGLGKLTEENCHTPIGDFGVIEAFGIKANPGTTLPYLNVDENTYCCSDSTAYNKMIDITKLPHECDGEHLIEYTPQYNYGFFLDYNKECKVGEGSAVFFHCKGPNNYTGACIAVDESSMIKILQNMDAGCRVIIDYAPNPTPSE